MQIDVEERTEWRKQKNKGLEAVKSDMKTAIVYVDSVEDRICGRIVIRMTDLNNWKKRQRRRR